MGVFDRYFTVPVESYKAPLQKGTYAKRDWADAVLLWSGKGCDQPDKAWESRSPARDTSQERLSLWLPSTAAVDATGRLLVRGVWWEVDGEPAKWLHGSLPHIRVRAWRVEH